jgi:CheY-specific phosphatase CheX
MSVKFFGQFLLERGKIIREELLDALELQKQSNAKLGTIALDAGYLTAKQIEEVVQRQQQTDKMFGEIALDMKYLNAKQLQDLMEIQKNEKMSLGESLVKKGYLSLTDLEQELAAFKKSQEGVVADVYHAVRGCPIPMIPEIFLDITIKLFRRMVDLDLDIIDFHTDAGRIAPYLWNIYQRFSGDSCGLFIISMPELIFLKVASHVAQEKIWEIDDLAKDSAREFVNVVVGNGAAKLSHEQNIRLQLQPAKFFTSLGTIEIPSESSHTIAVKLGSASHDLQNYSLQISLLYSPSNKAQ